MTILDGYSFDGLLCAHVADACGVEAVGWLVQNNQLGSVRNRLRELGKLLHPQRIRTQLAIARLAQSHIEQRLVRALQRRIARQADARLDLPTGKEL